MVSANCNDIRYRTLFGASQYGETYLIVLRMLAVDLMHKFEIGVRKTLFTQVVPDLYAASRPPGMLVGPFD